MNIKHCVYSLLILFLTVSGSHASSLLKTYQALATNGARDVTPFVIKGESFLAIPQLAEDIEGTAANMNGGNSDVPVLIYRWHAGTLARWEIFCGAIYPWSW